MIKHLAVVCCIVVAKKDLHRSSLWPVRKGFFFSERRVFGEKCLNIFDVFLMFFDVFHRIMFWEQ